MSNFVFSKKNMPSSVKRNTFRKAEKLCSQKEIDRIFSEGKSLSLSPFRLLYLETEANENPPVKVLIAVPKKKLKLAVHRNRMKRLIREAYRMSKHKLIEVISVSGKHFDIAFIFTGNKCITQKETLTAINGLLDRLILTHEIAMIGKNH
jgi:ribonuclease P protein component